MKKFNSPAIKKLKHLIIFLAIFISINCILDKLFTSYNTGIIQSALGGLIFWFLWEICICPRFLTKRKV